MNPGFLRVIAVSAAFLAGSGCMSVYKLPAGAPSTTIELPGGVVPWICARSEPQRLMSGKDGKAVIPVGERIVIGANLAYSDGYMNYYCSASASFVPSADHDYQQDFVTEGNYCSSLVYRKAPDDKRIGLAFEPTLSPRIKACVFEKSK